jgi:hypothetical protein
VIALVDVTRVWFKAKSGIQYTECARRGSVCDYVVQDETPELVIIEDMINESQFSDHILVTQNPKVRFCISSPIIIDGVKIGAFCVFDCKPRTVVSKKERCLVMEIAEIISNTISDERNSIMETEKDLAYVTSSVLNIIKHPLKKAINIMPNLRVNYMKLLESYNLSPPASPSAHTTTHKPLPLKTIAADEIKNTSLELQKEIQTLQELLQISLKSIMRIFRIGNYLQHNIHHHDHYFNPNKVMENYPPTTTASTVTSFHQTEHSISSHTVISRANTHRNHVLRMGAEENPSMYRAKTGLPTVPIPRSHTFKASNNNNMILWNSDDNLHKLNAIVENYRPFCSIVCSQHEHYILNKDSIRLFTHSDIILLMLILILNYAKNTDHRCEVKINLKMSGLLEKEFHYVRKHGIIEIDIKLIDLLIESGRSTSSTRYSQQRMRQNQSEVSNLLHADSQDTVLDEYNGEEAATIYTFDDNCSKNTTNYGTSFREIEDSDHNMLLTALNLVQWVSGEFSVDAIELPSDSSSSLHTNRLVSHCLIKIPCFEKVLESEYKADNSSEFGRLNLGRKSSSFNTSNDDLDTFADNSMIANPSVVSSIISFFSGFLCGISSHSSTRLARKYRNNSNDTQVDYQKRIKPKPTKEESPENTLKIKKSAIESLSKNQKRVIPIN